MTELVMRLDRLRTLPHQGLRAFTLVELLVVIAIIGALVALLLPAVLQSRAAAQRAACQNNLRQLGLALLAYHNAHQNFPRGGWGARANELSWTARLLPWLEQQPLADTLDRTVPYTDAANLVAGQTIVSTLECPSLPQSPVLRPSADLPSSSPHRYAVTSYGAVQGERGLRATNATNNPERGAMIFEREIAIREITDGTSHTALVGEAPEGIHSLWISVRNLFDQSAPVNTRAVNGTIPFADFGQELSSYHAGGANLLLADGSVQFLEETIDNQTLAAFCSRAAAD